MKDRSEPEPEATQRLQHAWNSQSGQEENGGDNQSPAAHRPAPHQGPEGKNRENDRKGKSKRPVRRARRPRRQAVREFPPHALSHQSLTASQLADSYSQSGHTEYQQSESCKGLLFSRTNPFASFRS